MTKGGLVGDNSTLKGVKNAPIVPPTPSRPPLSDFNGSLVLVLGGHFFNPS